MTTVTSEEEVIEVFKTDIFMKMQSFNKQNVERLFKINIMDLQRNIILRGRKSYVYRAKNYLTCLLKPSECMCYIYDYERKDAECLEGSIFNAEQQSGCYIKKSDDFYLVYGTSGEDAAVAMSLLDSAKEAKKMINCFVMDRDLNFGDVENDEQMDFIADDDDDPRLDAIDDSMEMSQMIEDIVLDSGGSSPKAARTMNHTIDLRSDDEEEGEYCMIIDDSPNQPEAAAVSIKKKKKRNKKKSPAVNEAHNASNNMQVNNSAVQQNITKSQQNSIDVQPSTSEVPQSGAAVLQGMAAAQQSKKSPSKAAVASLQQIPMISKAKAVHPKMLVSSSNVVVGSVPNFVSPASTFRAPLLAVPRSILRFPPTTSQRQMVPLMSVQPVRAPMFRPQDPPNRAPLLPSPPKGALRKIVIDGSNVAMMHGKNKIFSCRGIELVIDFFEKRGHREIAAFVPQWRRARRLADNAISDHEILEKLYQKNQLFFTPSREVDGKMISSYDDRFILKHASDEGGIVVSNDQYRDLYDTEPSFRDTIEKRILQVTFVGDKVMFPDDPLGRNGPNLDEFLSHDSHADNFKPICLLLAGRPIARIRPSSVSEAEKLNVVRNQILHNLGASRGKKKKRRIMAQKELRERLKEMAAAELINLARGRHRSPSTGAKKLTFGIKSRSSSCNQFPKNGPSVYGVQHPPLAHQALQGHFQTVNYVYDNPPNMMWSPRRFGTIPRSPQETEHLRMQLMRLPHATRPKVGKILKDHPCVIDFQYLSCLLR